MDNQTPAHRVINAIVSFIAEYNSGIDIEL